MLALLVAQAGAVVPPAVPLPAGVAPATSAQVLAAVHSAASGGSVPATLNPKLSAFDSVVDTYRQTGVALLDSCTPNLTSNASQIANPVACEFGNLSSSKTIVIYGDSNVGNWFPALSLGLGSSAYRLMAYSYAGCPTADLPYTAAMLTTSAAALACRTWHSAVERQISALHPLAIIAVSSYELVSVSPAIWASGIAKFFTAATVQSPRTKRFIMGTSPFFMIPVAQCLARAQNISSCALHLSQTYGSILSTRDPLVASVSKAKLILTSQWFCSGQICPAVVAGNMVAADHDHLTQVESVYLSKVATAAVLRALS